MIKRFICGVLTVSMFAASVTALAENENIQEDSVSMEFLEGDVQNDVEPVLDTQTDTDGDIQYDVYDPDKEYEIGDTVILMADGDDDSEVSLFATATLKGKCLRHWQNNSGSITNLYPDKWCGTRTSYLSLGQKFDTEEIWYVDSGYYVYKSTTNFWNSSNTVNYGQLWYKDDGTSKVYSTSHTITSYQSAHPHYAVCDYCGTVYSKTSTSSSCTTCYPPYVYYYGNGGSGAPSYQSGYPITISSTIPTRFPYMFKGWNTNSSSSYASYVGGNSYYGSANSSTYLYAVWESSGTLASSANSSGSKYIYPSGVTGYLSFVAPETATYAFESTGSADTYGYLYNSSGTQLSNNDDGGDNQNFRITYPLTKGTTYYVGAKYYSSTTGSIYVKARRQYEVKYNANGGSGAPSAQTKLYGDSVTISSTTPTNGDFKFLGWSTSSTAKTATYSGGDTYSANSDVTLYAVYEPITGQCGDNLTWTLDANGTLTISGTGDMWGWRAYSTPWYDYRDAIKNVVINNGVTSIGKCAFYHHTTGLKNIIMPNSITQIGEEAFGHCYALENINLPEGLLSIGSDAFYVCKSLTSIDIPASVTSIGNAYVFASCYSMNSINVEEANQYYKSENGVLYDKNGTTLIQYPAGKTDESYSIPHGVKTIGISAMNGNKSLIKVDIPATVTRIGSEAFNGCSSLAEVNLPEGIISIEGSLFNACSSLKEVNIPSSVRRIGNYAFDSCRSLTNLTIPDNVTYIARGAFMDCSGLTSMTIPKSIGSIDTQTFYGCESLTDVYYKGLSSEWEKVTIEHYNDPLISAKMHYMSNVPEATEADLPIGKSVTITATEGAKIYYTVNGEVPTTESTLYSESFSLAEAGEYIIRAIAVEEPNMPSAVAEKTITIDKAPIPVSSVAAGQILKNRTVALSVDDENTVIYYTTDGSAPTTESLVYSSPITIDEPKTIKAISVKAGYAISDEAVYSYSILGVAPTVLINISNIDGGKSIILSNEIEEAKIYYTLDSTTLTESSTLYTAPIEIKTAGVKYIKAIAVIENCANSPVTSDIVAVEKLDAPRTQNEVYRLEKGSAVELIPPMPDAEIYYTLDGSTPTVESTKYTEKIIMNKTATIKAVAVKQGYVTSDTASFAYTVYEKSETPIIEIKSDKGIYTAEIICDGANDIYYTLDGSEPKASSNKYSEPIALNEAKTYTIKAISVKAGYENSDIAERKITLEKTAAPSASVEEGRVEKGTAVSLTGDGTIYYSVNGDAESIYTEPIVIDGNTEIRAYAVANGKLRSDEVSFSYRTEKNTSGTDGAITWLYENGTLTISGSGAIPDYTEEIKPGWSELNDEIKRIVIEDGITTIGSYAFAGLENAISVTIPESVLTIGTNAFEGCAALSDVLLPDKLISIGKEAFKGCGELKELSIPGSVEVISEGAFEGLNKLTSIMLPFVGSQQGSKNSTEVFSFIFGGNVPETLKKVILTNETVIPANAFKDCVNIESINLNNEVRAIGTAAFDGCVSLKEFVIPDGVTAINDNTFRGCANITSITIPDSVSKIGVGAFDGCRKLDEIHIPNGVTTINDYTFRDCEMLYSLEIPSGVESIGIDALKGCRMLHTLKIPFVGANANPGATAVTNEGVLGYLFGKSDTGVVQGEFAYAIPPSLTKVEVVGTANGYIPPGAFMNCANIVDILIDGDRTVCANAFSNCRLLSNLYIPRSISTIGSNILTGCVNLKTLTVPFIGTSRSDTGTETSVLGGFFGYDDADITGIQQYYDSANFHYYKIPTTLKNVSVLNQTNIPYGAFMECYGLEKVSIVSGAALNDKAFYNCTGLNKVLLPKDLLTMGKESFAECENLESINLPDGTKSIGDNSFYNARKMREITIPRSVEQIADEVFNGTGMFGLSEVMLMASGVNIICASGSKAEEFAIEKGLNYTIVDDSELNIKQTSTTVELLSDNSYLFDVTDSYRQEGILHIDVYDAEANLLSSKTTEAGDVEYRISFDHEEIADISYAIIYIEDEEGNLVTTGAEFISVDGGEIPEIPENDIKLKYDDGKVSVIGTGNLKKGTVLIQAIYEDNVLKTVHTYNIQGLNIPIDIDADFAETDTVKLMIWESLDSMNPMADYLVI